MRFVCTLTKNKAETIKNGVHHNRLRHKQCKVKIPQRFGDGNMMVVAQCLELIEASLANLRRSGLGDSGVSWRRILADAEQFTYELESWQEYLPHDEPTWKYRCICNQDEWWAIVRSKISSLKVCLLINMPIFMSKPPSCLNWMNRTRFRILPAENDAQLPISEHTLLYVSQMSSARAD